MAALSDSPASTDSVLSRTPAPAALQQRLRELDADNESVASFDDAPLARISYRRLTMHYTLVPVTAALTLAFFVMLLFVCFPKHPSVPAPSPPDAPDHGWSVWPLRELLVAAAAWAACYALRGPVYALSTIAAGDGAASAAAAAVAQSVLEEAARLGVLALLVVRPGAQLEAFARAWWIALGWATAEVVVSIAQAYAQLALYRDVLRGDSDGSDAEELEAADDSPSDERTTLRPAVADARRYFAVASAPPVAHAPRPERASWHYDDPSEYLEAELNQLIAIKSRAEIEDVYGVPLPNIPVFLSALQRIDAIVLTMGLTLLLAAAWSRAVATHAASPHGVEYGPALFDTLPTLAAVAALHAGLALVWAVGLPRIGVPTASYTALLVALGSFITGLASWGILY